MPKKTLRKPYDMPSPRFCRDCGKEVRKKDLREQRAREINAETVICPFCWLTDGPTMDIPISEEAPNNKDFWEVKHARQIEGEPTRRFFTNGQYDLLLWLEGKRLIGYQLVLPSGHEQTAVTWRDGSGFSIYTVDNGEGRPARPKMTPVLTVRTTVDADSVLKLFKSVADYLPHGYANLIETTLSDLADQEPQDNS
ncbi:hypothetical protein BVX97_01230 [bacterium E08(2017)]|nr:hypothetical protein BVX97_01230 [bacterium E08(2017)]